MITIEKVLPSDAEELLKVYGPYVESTAISFEYTIPTLEDFTNRIETISKKYPYLKAVNEAGEIIGYTYAGVFKGRAAYDKSVETTIYIRNDQKRTGVGRALYAALEHELDKLGIRNLYACIAYIEIEDEHLTNDSMRFHEKMGYNLVGTFHKCGYKFDKYYDMIWMEKFLRED